MKAKTLAKELARIINRLETLARAAVKSIENPKVVKDNLEYDANELRCTLQSLLAAIKNAEDRHKARVQFLHQEAVECGFKLVKR